MQKKAGRKTRSGEEEFLESEYKKLRGGKYSKKKKQTSAKQRKTVIGICIGAVALLLLVLGAVLFLYLSNGTITGQIFVAGVNLDGMKKYDAIRAVRTAAGSTIGKTDLQITVSGDTVIIPADCVSTPDVTAVVEKAYAYSREHGESASDTPYIVDLEPFLSVDKKKITDILQALAEKYSTELKQSTFEVLGDAPTAEQIEAGTDLQKLVIHIGTPECVISTEDLYRQVMDAYSRNVFSIAAKCDLTEPDAVDLTKISEQYCVAPVDACWDANTSDIIGGTPGFGFDPDTVAKQISEAAYGDTVEIPFVKLVPAVTRESLSETMFQDILGTFTANHTSDKNRLTNLELACAAINGMVLEPGQVFSYNQALGERTAARGYKPGASYSGNETVYTIGGGICQISSSLYYCALCADLEIISRDNHRFAPNYMPLGTDATVNWGTLDFRFKNNTGKPIRIEASATPKTTTVTIRGTDEKAYYVEIESQVVSESSPVTTYRKMAEGNSEGYKNGDYIVTPYRGYDVKTYMRKYDKTTKKLISKDFITRSVYSKRDAVICEIESYVPNSTPSGSDAPGISGTGSVSDTGELPPE